MNRKNNNKIKNMPIYNLFLFFIIINFILIFLGIYFYNESYLFWQYPFSYIGAEKTVNGLENNISSFIYSLDMILSSFLMFIVSYYYKINKNKFFMIICFLSGFGFIIAGFSPDDRLHNFHMFGSALTVAFLWFLATNYLLIIKKKLNIYIYYFLQILLQVPIICYAIVVFLNLNPIDGFLQKISFLTLFFILIYSTIIQYKFNIK